MKNCEKELFLINLKRKMYECLAEIGVEAKNPTEIISALWGYEKLLAKFGDGDADG